MKPEHKKYIIDNIAVTTAEEIAKTLGIKAKDVRRFLKTVPGKRSDASGRPGARGTSVRVVKPASLFIMIALGALVYLNSIGGSFVWDDYGLVSNNEFIKGWKYLKPIFLGYVTDEVWNSTVIFYRPLQMLTYIFDHSVWGLDARGYHATNILLHLFTAAGIYFLVITLFNDEVLAFLTGTLFVVHPVHTEAVSYISGRSDLLAAVFFLLCLVYYVKWQREGKGIYGLITSAAYVGALLSREASVILPLVIIVCYHYAFKKKIILRSFLPIVIITLIYAVIRLTVLQDHTATLEAARDTVLQRLPGFFAAIVGYMRVLLLPVGLHMEYGNKLFSFLDPYAITGMVVVGAAIFYLIRIKGKDPRIFFSITWFFITLLPVSNIFPVNAHMAEHWLYLPSLGFFIIAAKIIRDNYNTDKLRYIAVIFVAAVVALYSFLTYKQNLVWRTPLALYENALKYSPLSARLYNNIGQIYEGMGKPGEAINAYKKAVEIDPLQAVAYYNLGNIYRDAGNREEAKKLYEKAIEIDPTNASAYYNAGNEYFHIGDIDKAVGLWKRSLDFNPVHAKSYFNLSVAYSRKGEPGLAVGYCEKAIDLGYDEVPPGYLEHLRSAVGVKK